MQPRFKFYVKQSTDVNWTLLADEPEGWQDLQDGITRDYAAHGLLVDTKCTLTFIGDGYDYIKNVFDCQSFCAEIQIKIDESCSEGEPYTTCFEGLIKMGDVKEQMNRCVYDAPIIDNSYFARIKNNAGIEAYPHVGKSKNGIDITVASMNMVDMFNPTNGAYFGVNRKAYRLFELGKFLVAFMSDGEMDFASDLLDTGDLAGEFLSNGAHLKDNNSSNYQNADIGKLTWDSFIDEIYKFGNVGFTIEYGGVKPVLRLEDADYFFGSTVIDTLANANGVIRKIKTDQLYAYVNFGSDKTIPQSEVPALSFPDEIDFLGWKDEKLHLTGQCNTENTLDLKGSWVRSSNVIEDLLLGITAATVDTYDEDFILISAEPTGGGNYQAIKYDIFNLGTAPYYYNGNLTNKEIALRFLGAIPNTLASYLDLSVDAFRASQTGYYPGPTAGIYNTATFFGPVRFNDDSTAPNTDPQNNYSTVNFEFVAPIFGRYDFYSELLLNLRKNLGDGSVRIAASFKRYDSFGTYIEEAVFYDATSFFTGGGTHYDFVVSGSGSLLLNIGDKVQVHFYKSAASLTYNIKPDSYFQCDPVSISGGTFQKYNPEDFNAFQYTFEYPISNSRWKAIKADPQNKLAFNIDGINDIEPWIERITYNKKDSMANITLIGKQKISC